MKTFLAPNQFYSDVLVPETSGSAAACVSPPLSAAAEQVSKSTLDPATGVDAATAPDLTDPPVAVAADPIDHIHELFAYASHRGGYFTMNYGRFVPDEEAIWDAMFDENAPRARADARVWDDPAPIFLKDFARTA